jgi:hypothetical protein
MTFVLLWFTSRIGVLGNAFEPSPFEVFGRLSAKTAKCQDRAEKNRHEIAGNFCADGQKMVLSPLKIDFRAA